MPPWRLTTRQSSTRSSVVTASSRGLASMVESPSAPSRIASSRSSCMAAISARAGPRERIALDAVEQRAEPDVAGHVDGDALPLERLEIAAERRPGVRLAPPT